MSAGARIKQLAAPIDYARTLHPLGRPGRVVVTQKMPAKWSQRGAYTVEELPYVLPTLAGVNDVYLTTQRFWGYRRLISKLAELGALAVDLDYYRRPDYIGAHSLGVLEDALVVLERAAIPVPSLAIGSGRGLYLLWLHKPVPRTALPRWNECQRELCEVLRPLGADPGARDAARVLRLVGSRHGGTGVLVEALTSPGEVWDFDMLADEVLQMTRAELRDLRVQRAARAVRKPSKWHQAPPEGYTRATLWEARLSDLQVLRRHRWFGILPDFRDRWLFLAGVAMSWICQPVVLQRELYGLARDVGGWTEGCTRSKMQAVFRTTREALAGKKVEFGGELFDPRYRFTNQRIIDLLEITPEEERQMTTIISDDERRRRDKERKREQRRRSGMQDRAAIAAERLKEAQKRRFEGQSIREIAEALKLSERHVKRLFPPLGERGVT